MHHAAACGELDDADVAERTERRLQKFARLVGRPEADDDGDAAPAAREVDTGDAARLTRAKTRAGDALRAEARALQQAAERLNAAADRLEGVA